MFSGELFNLGKGKHGADSTACHLFLAGLQIVSRKHENQIVLHLVVNSHSCLQSVLNQKVTFVTAKKMTKNDRCNWTIKANNL